MNEIIQKRRLKWPVCVLLAIVTLALYAPIAGNKFINLDDTNYVLNNSHVRQGLTWNTVKWAFSAFDSSNWHPLTWLSHALDCQLYGLNPAGHHLTNLAFHIANTLLLFLLLQNLTARLWPSAFVALLFAIHPLHVESVAWVAERKDVLSAFFFLLTLLAYARYVELARAQNRRCWFIYGLTLLLFALGLMAKPMLVTLPCVLCLLDYWPLRRFEFPLKNQPGGILRRLVLEKIPFLVLTVFSCWVTFIAQSHSESVKPITDYSLADRLANTPAVYAWYVFKLFWPANLSIYYPLQVSQPDWLVIGAWGLILGLTLLAIRVRREQPFCLVGWFWFMGMMAPVSGLIQVGNQAYANRYSYLPYIGLFIIVAWGIPKLLTRWRCQKTFLVAGALVVFTALSCLTVTQIRFWKNAQTLFERAIALDQNNEFAWRLLGLEFMNQGNADKAVECLRRSTAINPAIFQAWNDLGLILCTKGEFAEAQSAYQTALQYAPHNAVYYCNLADLLAITGQYKTAISNFQRSLELAPDQPETCKKLGRAYLQNHEWEKALVQFQNALRLEPDDPEARMTLAMTFADHGQDAEAIQHYRKILNLNSNLVIALNNLAWLLATGADPRLRNGNEAVRLAERACKLTQYQEAFLIGTLAAAYAEAGRFDDAVTTAQKARTAALAQGQKEVAAANEQLLELYQSGKAYHQAAKVAP